MLLKCVPHVQHNYFFLIRPIRSLFSGVVFAVAFVLAKNSLINAMKRRLGAGESYVNGNVKSVANDFHGILRLLRKVKDFIYVRCWWSITSRFMLRLSHWVEYNERVTIMRVFRNCPRWSVTRVISANKNHLLDDFSFIVISPMRFLHLT